MREIMRWLRKRVVFGLASIELLFVITIISVLSPILLADSSETGYARWLKYKDKLRHDSNLVAYYTFEEGKGIILKNQVVGPRGDKSYKPEELNGTILYDAEWTEGRWRGKSALSFNGGRYVSCGDSDSLNITDGITVEAWVKFPAYRFQNIVYRMKTGGKTDTAYGLRISPNSIFVDTFISETRCQRGGASKANYPAGPWYYLAATFDGTTLSFYVNGNLGGSADHPGTIDGSTGETLYVGKAAGYASFKGTIGEVAIYNRALTETEIKEHYEMGKP